MTSVVMPTQPRNGSVIDSTAAGIVTTGVSKHGTHLTVAPRGSKWLGIDRPKCSHDGNAKRLTATVKYGNVTEDKLAHPAHA